jgi:hypothetical protein
MPSLHGLADVARWLVLLVPSAALLVTLAAGHAKRKQERQQLARDLLAAALAYVARAEEHRQRVGWEERARAVARALAEFIAADTPRRGFGAAARSVFQWEHERTWLEARDMLAVVTTFGQVVTDTVIRLNDETVGETLMSAAQRVADRRHDAAARRKLQDCTGAVAFRLLHPWRSWLRSRWPWRRRTASSQRGKHT